MKRNQLVNRTSDGLVRNILTPLFLKWDVVHSGASNARLYQVTWGKAGAWVAKISNKGQWLEVDLGKTTKVTMVATQGRYDYDQWVKSYKVAYSKYSGHFVFHNKVSIKSKILHKPASLEGKLPLITLYMQTQY